MTIHRKIKVVHIIRDQKFSEGTVKHFEDDGRFENECILVTKSPNYFFKYIKEPNKVKLLYSKQMVKEYLRSDYDVIFFHSLLDYHLFNYIPDDKVVIWWIWGDDLYGRDRFIDIALYKPLTHKYLNTQCHTLVAIIRELLKSVPFLLDLKHGSRKRAIKRIDYVQPIVHYEFELLSRINGFHAKEFYYPGSRGTYFNYDVEHKQHNGKIIIGNSASLTNNHLDVCNSIEPYIPSSSEVIIPISYGDMNYAQVIESSIKLNGNVKFLKDYMPIDAYNSLLVSCSYAVYGVIRQQAQGNIYRCLASGVKVFLYKDSILFHYLTELGCVIYAIEDINELSFREPLSVEDAKKNQLALSKEYDMVEKVREQSIAELQYRLLNN